MALILPNLIIAGASKCGTTSLFRYLADHPQVCAASTKETRYLIDPGYPLYQEDCNYQCGGLEGYAQFFNNHDEHKQNIIMEATPDYLYQETPLNVLPTFEQIPMVVFMLRKPSERVYSMYQFARHNMGVLDESISFGEFLDMISSQHPWMKKRMVLLNVVEHGKYIRYLSLWREVLGAEKVHILLFEDFIVETQVVMTQLAQSLGIDANFYQRYECVPKNESVVMQNRFLHNLKQKCEVFLPKSMIRTLAGQLYQKLNTRKPVRAKSEEDLELLAKLDEMYAPFNEELQRVTNLNLELWQ